MSECGLLRLDNVAYQSPLPILGVVAGVGGIPNALRRSPQLGPYLLTGEPIPPHLLAAHVFTETVPTADVLPAALRWAAKLVEASPDAVWATKEHMNQHKDGMGVSAAVDAALKTDVSKSVFRGENIQEGLCAFVEVRRSCLEHVRRCNSATDVLAHGTETRTGVARPSPQGLEAVVSWS